MNLYEYSVWFRDHNSLPTDQDYEWVACFNLEASSSQEARSWGDEISKSYSIRNPKNEFLKSIVIPTGDIQLPKVKFGFMPSDRYIGW